MSEINDDIIREIVFDFTPLKFDKKYVRIPNESKRLGSGHAKPTSFGAKAS